MIDNYTMVSLVRMLEVPKDSLFTLSVETKKKVRELKEDIQSINKILSRNNYPKIKISENKYKVPEDVTENSEKVFELFHLNQVSFLPSDRINIIYLFTYSRNNFVSNFHYQDILHVSKNTALNDIHLLREDLEKYEIELAYSRGDGYHLVGKEANKHQYAYKVISELQKRPIGEWVMDYILKSLDEVNKTTELHNEVVYFEREYNIQSIQVRLTNTLYLLQFLLTRYKRNKKINDLFSEKFFIGHPIVRELSESLCDIFLSEPAVFDEDDLLYIELLFLGSFEVELESEREAYFEDLVEEIVTEMEKLSLIQFDNRDEMITGMKRHLIPAYYRISLGFEDLNDYTEVIINQNLELFNIVKKALNPLQRLFKKEIPNSEVAYFLVHFGGYIKQYNQEIGKVKALIVCPNGISSSLILKEQLSNLFPDITFLNTHRLDDVLKMEPESYDIVFSTINLKTDKRLFIVPVTLTVEKREELYALVYEEISVLKLKPSPINEMLSVISQYTTIHDETNLRLELTKLFYNTQKTYNRKGESPLLHELIREDTFQYSDEKLEWKEAFYLASKPLLEREAITENYVEKMIGRVEEYGPFINLGKGVAIPHARPEDGVSELSMSMLVLEEAIYLPEDDKPVNILIVIAATDNESHLSALSHLTTILREDEQIDQLTNAKKFDDIVEVIYQGGEE